MGLDIYEIISIGISNISINLGTPAGAKNAKNFIIPCLYIAIPVTPKNIKNEIFNNFHWSTLIFLL